MASAVMDSRSSAASHPFYNPTRVLSSRPATPVRTGSKFLAEKLAADASESTNVPRDHGNVLDVWNQVNAELSNVDCTDDQSWWIQSLGKALAVLLYNAKYTPDAQYLHLKFFDEVVATHLGAAPGTGRPQWPSFMTDSGYPVELSWDWGTGDKSPSIRYSIEPIGLAAGSQTDPGNFLAGPSLQKILSTRLPDMRLEWFHHFDRFFNTQRYSNNVFIEDRTDHNTSMFYAFDLSPKEVMAKSYFFPKLRPKLPGQTSLDVLSESIRTAPEVTEDKLVAWSQYCDFCHTYDGLPLEQEMLAIDHIDPRKSRLKIYFRSRETSFESVTSIMTLGGRANSVQMCRGLIDLARLWSHLFGLEAPLHQSLPSVTHRTAGMLYNLEFKLGDALPITKIYLPVRHYSPSDDATIRGLGKFFEQSGRGEYVCDFTRTMETLFSAEKLRAGSDVQTYVACSIRSNGSLRVTSYFKAQSFEGHTF